MQTITIDIINKKVISLLQYLELLQLIRLHQEEKPASAPTNWTAKYKGAITKQSLTDIDNQLNELRNGVD